MTASRACTAALVAVCLAAAEPSAAQTGTRHQPQPAPATPAAAAEKADASSPAFVAASKAAESAREAGRLDEAIGLYRKAVAMRPSWLEGWWYVGAMSYELDRYEQGRDAFRRVVQLEPKHASAWGLLGLCEFQLKDYDSALRDLLRARMSGVDADREVASVVRYHAAVLLSRSTEYEQALQILGEFAAQGNDTTRVLEAFGIAALRMPMLPEELPGTARDAVMMAGRAQYFSAARQLPAARQAFEQLVGRYPDMPSVHYAYGVFLLGEEPDLGIEELKKELAISPNDNGALLMIAFEYIKRSDYPTARTWAQKAVDGVPTNFVARKALGQVLYELGDIDGAIRELEAGVAIAPDSPVLHFQLAKAYQRAGRTSDAERERAEFTRLDRLLRGTRTGGQPTGRPAGSAAPPKERG